MGQGGRGGAGRAGCRGVWRAGHTPPLAPVHLVEAMQVCRAYLPHFSSCRTVWAARCICFSCCGSVGAAHAAAGRIAPLLPLPSPPRVSSHSPSMPTHGAPPSHARARAHRGAAPSSRARRPSRGDGGEQGRLCGIRQAAWPADQRRGGAARRPLVLQVRSCVPSACVCGGGDRAGGRPAGRTDGRMEPGGMERAPEGSADMPRPCAVEPAGAQHVAVLCPKPARPRPTGRAPSSPPRPALRAACTTSPRRCARAR